VKQGTENNRKRGEEMSLQIPFLWRGKAGNVHGYCELLYFWLWEEKQVSICPVTHFDLSSFSLVGKVVLLILMILGYFYGFEHWEVSCRTLEYQVLTYVYLLTIHDTFL
jgi:hypothetical protein